MYVSMVIATSEKRVNFLYVGYSGYKASYSIVIMMYALKYVLTDCDLVFLNKSLADFINKQLLARPCFGH